MVFSQGGGKAWVSINCEGFYFNESRKFKRSKYKVKLHLYLAQTLQLDRKLILQSTAVLCCDSEESPCLSPGPGLGVWMQGFRGFLR